MRESIKIFTLIILVAGTTGCSLRPLEKPAQNNAATSGFQSPTSLPSVNPPASEPSVTPPKESPQGGSSAGKCGLQSCHGLDLTCGPDVPEVCTEEYRIGDFCRQYAICEIIGGQCSMVPEPKLEECINCAKDCERADGQEAFDCEAQCREKIQ